MKNNIATLVGDGIENPGNALTMIHAAEMYGVACRFRDTKGLLDSELLRTELDGPLSVTTSSQIADVHSRIVALDNLPNARDVYGFKPGKDFAVVVGNERRGLSHELLDLATDTVQIPMLSRQINTLNVAAASAVALHYMCRENSGKMVTRQNPSRRRPELLLLAVCRRNKDENAAHGFLLQI